MKSKIQQVTGQRIGQLIINALKAVDADREVTVFITLSAIEDEDLIRIVKEYIETNNLNKTVPGDWGHHVDKGPGATHFKGDDCDV